MRTLPARLALLALALWVAPAARAQSAGSPDPGRDARWQADLDSLVAVLPARHPDLFAHAGPERFRAEAAALRARIPSLSDPRAMLGMMRLVSLAGDAHTAVGPPRSIVFRPLPLRFFWYEDGIRVVSAPPGRADLLGATLAGVGTVDVDSAVRALRGLVAEENEMYLRHRMPSLLVSPDALHDTGLSDGPDRAVYRLRVDGEVRVVPLHLPDGEVEMVTAEPADTLARALYRRRPRSIQWWTYLPESRMVYVQYNRCVVDPAQSMADFAAEVFAAADSLGTVRMVVDLRMNGGGNSAVLRPFIQRLREHRLNAPGRLFVVIGRRTASSAMMNAIELDRSTHAVLVGEPTGGRPNHFGEVRGFTLPGTGVRVFHSTRRFTLMPGQEGRTLEPEMPVAERFEATAAARDPVQEAIAALPPPP